MNQRKNETQLIQSKAETQFIQSLGETHIIQSQTTLRWTVHNGSLFMPGKKQEKMNLKELRRQKLGRQNSQQQVKHTKLHTLTNHRCKRENTDKSGSSAVRAFNSASVVP